MEDETPLIYRFPEGYSQMPAPWEDVYMNVTNITETLMDTAWIHEYVISKALLLETLKIKDYQENVVTTITGAMYAPVYNNVQSTVADLKTQISSLVKSKEFKNDIPMKEGRGEMLELRSIMFDYLVDGTWKMKHMPHDKVYSIKFGKKPELPLIYFLVSVTSRGNLRLLGWVRSVFHYFLHKIMNVEPVPRRIGSTALSYILAVMYPKAPEFLFLSYLDGAPLLTLYALQSMKLEQYPFEVPPYMMQEANGEKLVLPVDRKLLDFHKNTAYIISECVQCGSENAPYYAILWKHEEMPFCGKLCLNKFLKNVSS